MRLTLRQERYCIRHGLNPDEADIEEIEKGLKEESAQKLQAYYAEKKQYITERNKKYKIDNYEKVRERKKEYMAILTRCECGCEIVRNNITSHLKTKKHQILMAQRDQN